ncbi:Calcineurin-like_phosphoesterase [Hexamita inflata]|uniref:Calcineurin-like phosphoesterase n=1 Tax=Hexamita inflata TaxID=28002 RepID=A0AA86NW07_9EUKA|nr:Calcineurin-like phosphoesterase [Hexamita inflata]
MIRITAISDVHGKQDQLRGPLPGGDILFCTGDITPRHDHTLNGINVFLNWLDMQNYTYKVLICGNNDYIFQKYDLQMRDLIRKNYKSIVYLNDEQISLTVQGVSVSIFGTPHSVNGQNNAFVLNTLPDLQKRFSACNHPDFILSHGPPLGILDYNCGCPYLKRVIEEQSPKFHLFGHIHDGFGHQLQNGTLFINGAVLSLYYKVTGNVKNLVWDFQKGNVKFV